MTNTNFGNIITGSKVIICHRNTRQVFTVSHVTKTQVHIKITERYTRKFRKSDGGEIGGDAYHSHRIVSIAE